MSYVILSLRLMYTLSIILNLLPMYKEHFFISDGINGSATNYTITYYDPSSERICGHVTVSASSSTSGQYKHVFDIPSVCSHFTSIAITIFATNVLGDGPHSSPVLIVFSKLLHVCKIIIIVTVMIL